MEEEKNTMVSISLYKGNFHKVSDVPRQWLMPSGQISLKDFKILLCRRARALARLSTPNPNSNPKPAATDLASNNNNNNDSDANRGIGDAIDNGGADIELGIPLLLEESKGKDGIEEKLLGGGGEESGAPSEGGDCLEKMEVDASDSAAIEAKQKDDYVVEKRVEKGKRKRR